MKVAGRILGMVLLVVAGQGAIRLIVDHDDAGILDWVGGGFVVRLIVYVAVAAAGVGLAAWATRKPTNP